MSEASETEGLNKRPQFGNRFLPDNEDADENIVFKHNAWQVNFEQKLL